MSPIPLYSECAHTGNRTECSACFYSTAVSFQHGQHTTRNIVSFASHHHLEVPLSTFSPVRGPSKGTNEPHQLPGLPESSACTISCLLWHDSCWCTNPSVCKSFQTAVCCNTWQVPTGIESHLHRMCLQTGRGCHTWILPAEARNSCGEGVCTRTGRGGG